MQPVQIVAELVELAQSGRYCVQLSGRVVLELAVRGNLPLKLDEFFGPLVGPAQHLRPYGADSDQKSNNDQECGKEFRMAIERPSAIRCSPSMPMRTCTRQ